MAVFEDGGGRGSHIQIVYENLLTIKPTSVDSERAFSCAGGMCSKIRTRLSDYSLDALSFLRSHFMSLKKNLIEKVK